MEIRRTESLYKELEERFEPWIEPSGASDFYASTCHRSCCFWDEPERSLEWYRSIGDGEKKFSGAYEKRLEIWMGKNDDNDPEENVNDVHYLRMGCKKKSHLEKDEDPLKEFWVTDSDEEEKTLEEVWDWFLSDRMEKT